MSSFGHLIKDVLASISSLRSFSFSHTVRQGNAHAHAHALARRARLPFTLLIWMEFVPLDLDLVVVADFPAR